MKDCQNCANFVWGDMKTRMPKECIECEFVEAHPSNWKEKPQTNADRIRAMSDEELYLWAKKQIGCGFDFFPCGVVCDGKCESFDDETCKAKIMEWLKQPAEVKDNA